MPEPDVGADNRPRIRSNREALANCSKSCRMLLESVDTQGAVRVGYVGTVELAFRSMRELCRRVGAQVGRGSCVFPWADGAASRIFRSLHGAGRVCVT